jgi:two-component system, OmpR family, sensor histidine kinase KdpD
MAGPGAMRTYLGTAPGVGKTYAMLGEGRRRADRGEHVVVGWVEHHGRSGTRAQLANLETVVPKTVTYRGITFADMDPEAVIATGADLVLVDELAHTSPDGSRRRSEEVAAIRAAGLDVLTTMNVANLGSVREYAARLTGRRTVECVADDFVRSADVVLVDLPPEALRQRIASGQVYSAEGVAGALAEYFQPSNLEALGRLARAWMTDTLERVGSDLVAEGGLASATSRPLVVAGVSDSNWGERIDRAAEPAAENDTWNG